MLQSLISISQLSVPLSAYYLAQQDKQSIVNLRDVAVQSSRTQSFMDILREPN